MKIAPLAVTCPDWQVYIKTVEEVLNINPIKGLGETFIKEGGPIAYLSSLDFQNRPLDFLRKNHEATSILEHVSISFICQLESVLITKLIVKFSKIDYLLHEPIVIASGTMGTWHQAVIKGLHALQDKEIREFFHTIFGVFGYLGFIDLWANYKKSSGTDSYTIIGEKYA